MTEAQLNKNSVPKRKRREINWAQYLDYTLFIEQDVENEQLEKFKEDFYL